MKSDTQTNLIASTMLNPLAREKDQTCLRSEKDCKVFFIVITSYLIDVSQSGIDRPPLRKTPANYFN